MNKSIYIAMLVALGLVGCSSEPPTQAPVVNDDMIAEVTAGAIGYQSNGLAASLKDLTAAGRGIPLRESVGSEVGDVSVAEIDSSFDPGTRVQTIGLNCQRNRSDTFSEWRLDYQIRYADVDPSRKSEPRLVNPMTATSRTDGTYRNIRMTAQGHSEGKIRFDSLNLEGGAYLSGEYQWDGSSVIREGEESLDDLAIRFTWSRLYTIAEPRYGGSAIRGRCDVNISANGPNGAISKNGTLQFDGGDSAVLTIGSKHYVIDVRSSEVRRKS